MERKINSGEKPVFRMTYVSRAAWRLETVDFEAIAAVAKRNNTALGVTGLLVECAGEFLQILEGEAAIVRQLFDKIEHDPRHVDVSVVEIEEDVVRNFGAWAMGCFCFRPEDLPQGFFFERVDGQPRLRCDMMLRTNDMLTTFQRENSQAGSGASFASLVTA
ncbi:MAG: BLUF domain-containing protein [Rhodobacteraceae bacterium]|nr:BLUF domain-containing protein [Paracoccaceae bacterium]